MLCTGDSIDVWLTRYDAIDDDQLLHRMRQLLDDDERMHEQSFYFADDRRRYLVTRAMVRTVLSYYLPLPPDAWMFTKNTYVRPAIADAITDAWPEARGIAFNLSHTRGLHERVAAMAGTSDGEAILARNRPRLVESRSHDE